MMTPQELITSQSIAIHELHEKLRILRATLHKAEYAALTQQARITSLENELMRRGTGC